MNTPRFQIQFGVFLMIFGISILPVQAMAKNNESDSNKERLVLLPLHLTADFQHMQAVMETSLSEGLQQKYAVISGEQVLQKSKEILMRESRNTAQDECTDTKCFQNLAISFQAEFIAVVNITKTSGGYFLALNIRKVLSNESVYSKSIPCKGCDEFLVVEKLKELTGTIPQAPSSFTTMRTSGEPEMVQIPHVNYEIGKYEVTQGEWKALMGSDNNPSRFKNCGDICPEENVSWNDVQEFIKKLNAKTGKQYRLPTEKEWEYACYAGTPTDEFCGGNDASFFWSRDNSGGGTHAVGKKSPNAYGIFDMSGNVSEMTSSCYSKDCSDRARRGGSWYDNNSDLKVSQRHAIEDFSERSDRIGFRLARTLP